MSYKLAENCSIAALLSAVQDEFELTKEDLCGPGKASKIIQAKEVLVLCGRRLRSIIGRDLRRIGDQRFDSEPQARCGREASQESP